MYGEADEAIPTADEPYEASSSRLLADMHAWADQRVAAHEQDQRETEHDLDDLLAQQQARFDEIDRIMSGEIPWNDASRDSDSQ